MVKGGMDCIIGMYKNIAFVFPVQTGFKYKP